MVIGSGSLLKVSGVDGFDYFRTRKLGRLSNDERKSELFAFDVGFCISRPKNKNSRAQLMRIARILCIFLCVKYAKFSQ